MSFDKVKASRLRILGPPFQPGTSPQALPIRARRFIARTDSQLGGPSGNGQESPVAPGAVFFEAINILRKWPKIGGEPYYKKHPVLGSEAIPELWVFELGVKVTDVGDLVLPGLIEVEHSHQSFDISGIIPCQSHSKASCQPCITPPQPVDQFTLPGTMSPTEAIFPRATRAQDEMSTVYALLVAALVDDVAWREGWMSERVCGKRRNRRETATLTPLPTGQLLLSLGDIPSFGSSAQDATVELLLPGSSGTLWPTSEPAVYIQTVGVAPEIKSKLELHFDMILGSSWRPAALEDVQWGTFWVPKNDEKEIQGEKEGRVTWWPTHMFHEDTQVNGISDGVGPRKAIGVVSRPKPPKEGLSIKALAEESSTYLQVTIEQQESDRQEGTQLGPSSSLGVPIGKPILAVSPLANPSSGQHEARDQEDVAMDSPASGDGHFDDLFGSPSPPSSPPSTSQPPQSSSVPEQSSGRVNGGHIAGDSAGSVSSALQSPTLARLSHFPFDSAADLFSNTAAGEAMITDDDFDFFDAPQSVGAEAMDVDDPMSFFDDPPKDHIVAPPETAELIQQSPPMAVEKLPDVIPTESITALSPIVLDSPERPRPTNAILDDDQAAEVLVETATLPLPGPIAPQGFLPTFAPSLCVAPPSITTLIPESFTALSFDNDFGPRRLDYCASSSMTNISGYPGPQTIADIINRGWHRKQGLVDRLKAFRAAHIAEQNRSVYMDSALSYSFGSSGTDDLPSPAQISDSGSSADEEMSYSDSEEMTVDMPVPGASNADVDEPVGKLWHDMLDPSVTIGLLSPFPSALPNHSTMQLSPVQAQSLADMQASGRTEVTDELSFSKAKPSDMVLNWLASTIIENASLRSHLAGHLLDDGPSMSHLCVDGSDVSLQDLLDQSTDAVLAPNQSKLKLSIRRPKIFQLKPTDIQASHMGNVITLASTAVPLWEQLGLSPSGGSKNLDAYILFDSSWVTREEVDRWQKTLSKSYATRRYGRHRMAPGDSMMDTASVSWTAWKQRLGLLIRQAESVGKRAIIYVILPPTHNATNILGMLEGYYTSLKEVSRDDPPSEASHRIALHVVPHSVLREHASMGKISAAVYDRFLVAQTKPIARIIGDFYPPDFTYFQRPSYTLPQPDRISPFFSMQCPSLGAVVTSNHRFLHVAYGVSEDLKSAYGFCIDGLAEAWEVRRWRIDTAGEGGIKKLVDLVWEHAMRFADMLSIEWRVVLARLGWMQYGEVEAWEVLLKEEMTKPDRAVHVTIVICEETPLTDPSSDSLSLSHRSTSSTESHIIRMPYRRAIPIINPTIPQLHVLMPLFSFFIVETDKSNEHIASASYHHLISMASARSSLRQTPHNLLQDVAQSYADLRDLGKRRWDLHGKGVLGLPAHLEGVRVMKEIMPKEV